MVGSIAKDRFPPEQAWAALRAAAWYVMVLVSVLYPLVLDRRGMIDNDNYLDYFIHGRDFAWSWLFTEAESWVHVFFRLSTEEILWLLWTTLAGSILEPPAAVYATVAILNGLVILALRPFKNRALALAMWLIIPFGFAITGTYQIRQGLAFALWLYVAVRRERLVAGSVAAAMVHTTFSVVAVLSLIAARRQWSMKLRLGLLALTALALALGGEALFGSYGGRRLADLAVNDPSSLSLNFLLGLLIIVSYPLYLGVTRGERHLRGASGGTNGPGCYLVLYVGIIFFLIFSFFFFPVGNFRLPYIAWLGLIPIVSSFNFASLKANEVEMKRAVIGFGLIFAFLLYQALGAVLDNRYACIRVPNCASVLWQ